MQGAYIEDMVSRDPKELYDWIVELNEKSGRFAALCEDIDKKNEVKALCVLFSRREISFHDFIYHVENLDLFFHKDLGPLMSNYPTFDQPEVGPFPEEAIAKLLKDNSLRSIFQVKSS